MARPALLLLIAAPDSTALTSRLTAVVGLLALLGAAWLISGRRRPFPWKIVAAGLALQVVFALVILRTAFGRAVFEFAQSFVVVIQNFTREGTRFLFKDLADPGGHLGFTFAFQVLPTIIFFSSLTSILYHLGVLQKVVGGFAWLMRRTMRISGAESLSVGANVFIGMTEAPLVIRPYVSGMTSSELMTLMTGGFATIAGGVLVAYAALGIDPGHLLSASVMSAPAALLVSKILLPETETPATLGGAVVKSERQTVNVIDAAAAGAADGLKLAVNIGAMLLAFIALIYMGDWLIGLVNTAVDKWLLQDTLGWNLRLIPNDLKTVFGGIFGPLAWLMGVPAQDAHQVGTLMGEKIVINEFVAYISLGRAMELGSLQPRSIVIATYALCGFANFSAIAIQIGGIGGIAPDRKKDLARFGLRAMAGGAIASFMTATIAGIIL